MSKEFEEWMAQFKKTPEWTSDSFHWDDMARSAFTAGRALGRREMKGKVAEKMRVAVKTCREANSRYGTVIGGQVLEAFAALLDAIEAMPED